MTLVSRLPELESILNQATDAGCCAIDTEFVWERSYYPKLGLVQVGLPGQKTFLIDAPAVEDWTPIANLLANPDVVKILHDAQQDLRILKRACGASPSSIFDTQRVAGFVGLSSTISLSDLLKATLNIHLHKSETRSDWLKRPLTDKQLEYARDDVRYMVDAREWLLSKGLTMNRLDWIEAEMSLYNDPHLYDESIALTEMPRVKGSGALTREQRDIIRALAAWREEKARRRDLPRPFILSDEAMVGLARRPPADKNALSPLKGLTAKTLDRNRDAIWQAIEQGRAGDLPSLENGKRRGPEPDAGFEARVDLALAFVKGRCLESGLDPALAGNRAAITALVMEGLHARAEDHLLLRGWRNSFIASPLLELINGRCAIAINPLSGFASITINIDNQGASTVHQVTAVI
jgi:ribonuclease D